MQKPPTDPTADSADDSSAQQPADPAAGAAPARKSSRRRSRQRVVPDTTVPSPCVAVCRYNNEELCEGCLRTPDEIREWIIMTREQKLAVLSELERRRQSAAR